jgi:hypothetical protein
MVQNAAVLGIRDSNNLNAAQMSTAGNGLTEPHYDFIKSLILCRENIADLLQQLEENATI